MITDNETKTDMASASPADDMRIRMETAKVGNSAQRFTCLPSQETVKETIPLHPQTDIGVLDTPLDQRVGRYNITWAPGYCGWNNNLGVYIWLDRM